MTYALFYADHFHSVGHFGGGPAASRSAGLFLAHNPILSCGAIQTVQSFKPQGYIAILSALDLLLVFERFLFYL